MTVMLDTPITAQRAAVPMLVLAPLSCTFTGLFAALLADLGAIVDWRAVAGRSACWAVRRWKRKKTTDRGRDKSRCPDRRKSLTRLTFFRARRSVAGMLPGFSQRFQRFGMHSCSAALVGGRS
ncbi:hypothetical protein [Sphingomonas morindae]|uniref:Uncharacterized protein n=1 Tax=Sphingomonas morindae TaxID=1541170 RepID=A0ABY4X3Q2_9SPHN|nr:hypothetical protein [Sphingomonas morindae]USI71538.1 hypothetical protein LHA26_09315 [Sphingomonas morindae]